MQYVKLSYSIQTSAE